MYVGPVELTFFLLRCIRFISNFKFEYQYELFDFNTPTFSYIFNLFVGFVPYRDRHCENFLNLDKVLSK